MPEFQLHHLQSTQPTSSHQHNWLSSYKELDTGKYGAVVVLEVADWNKDGQRRRVRGSIISGDAPTVLSWCSHH